MASFYERLAGRDTCFVIAEVGVNHNGDLDLARRLIDVAARAGAEAVKFQTFFADELVTTTAAQADYQARNRGRDDSQYEMLRALELSEDDYRALKLYCDDKGIIFLSTPFSERAVDLLADIGVDGFKISSGDLTHLPLLRHIAGYGRPAILSTGMGTLGEIDEAVTAMAGAGLDEVAILHCVSNYPADPAECNLRAMDTIRGAFGKPTGWSDHTLGNAVSVAAVARGAPLIEKHFTLDRTMPGPDHAASLEPEELNRFVQDLRDTRAALGTPVKRPTASERETAKVARRSVTLRRALPAGHVLEAGDLMMRRPGLGLSPARVTEILGRRLVRDLDAEHVLTSDDFGPA